MSRYHSPRPRSSPYITAEGHARLKAEFEQLWHQRRPEVVKALAAAAAEGDRSENAEYQYRKKELREIDARLRYLTMRLQEVKVVDVQPRVDGRIYFGAWVTLADRDDARLLYRIVGADDADSGRGWISVDAPLARALMGRAAGDSFMVELPAGPCEYEVLDVRYDRRE